MGRTLLSALCGILVSCSCVAADATYKCDPWYTAIENSPHKHLLSGRPFELEFVDFGTETFINLEDPFGKLSLTKYAGPYSDTTDILWWLPEERVYYFKRVADKNGKHLLVYPSFNVDLFAYAECYLEE